MFFDGASKGNQSDSAVSIGFVIYDQFDKCIARHNLRTGMGHNNYAEYMAMLCGLKYCVDLGITRTRIIGDSQLIVR